MRADSTRPGQRPPRVLVVDDHARIRETIHRLLEPEFQILGEAEDGEQALKMARELEPEVVVLDIDLPKLDGLSVARQLAEGESRPHVVIVSVHPAEDTTRPGRMLHALAYVAKADLGRQLRAAVRAAAAGRRYP